MELLLELPRLYRVKGGQTLFDVARTFCIPPCVLARENALGGEIEEGQILLLPPRGGNRYTVRGGESRTLLCGSVSAFEKKNGTGALYPGQEIYL